VTFRHSRIKLVGGFARKTALGAGFFEGVVDVVGHQVAERSRTLEPGRAYMAAGDIGIKSFGDSKCRIERNDALWAIRRGYENEAHA
jgi:hypothetical protein